MLPFDIIDAMQHHFSQTLQLAFPTFAGLFRVLSMFLPSRPLSLSKVSENMEINMNSPRTVKRESDTNTSSIPTATTPRTDELTVYHGLLSSTASSLSDILDIAEAETETPRSIKPKSSVESEDSPSHKKILILFRLWTERSQKVD